MHHSNSTGHARHTVLHLHQSARSLLLGASSGTSQSCYKALKAHGKLKISPCSTFITTPADALQRCLQRCCLAPPLSVPAVPATCTPPRRSLGVGVRLLRLSLGLAQARRLLHKVVQLHADVAAVQRRAVEHLRASSSRGAQSAGLDGMDWCGLLRTWQSAMQQQSWSTAVPCSLQRHVPMQWVCSGGAGSGGHGTYALPGPSGPAPADKPARLPATSHTTA